MSTTPTLFDPIVNRPAPWWSTQTAREQLLTLAKPLTHQNDNDTNENIQTTDLENFDDDQVGYYVYSKQILTQRYKTLSNLKSVDCIFYAQKANNCPEIIQLLYSLGSSIECVSLNELKQVLTLYPDINGDRLLWTPNFASKRELSGVQQLFNTPERCQNKKITQIFPFVTIDNMYILENWDISKIFANVPIFLRIAPDTDGYGHHSHVSTGASSKFGIFQDDLLHFFQKTDLGKKYSPLIYGLHMHKGSGVSTSDEWSKTAITLLSHLSIFPSMTHIDIGGGLAIPYKPSDTQFDFSSLDTSLFEIKKLYPNIKFCIEPGRFLVAESGIMLTRVNQLKSKSCFKFVGISIGMNGLIRPSLYGSYHHIINLSKYSDEYLQQARSDLTLEDNTKYNLNFDSSIPDSGLDFSKKSVITNIVGPICESGDYLGKNRLLPSNTQEDDIILIDCTGAYGKVMASHYNLRHPVRDILIDFE